MLKRFEVKNFKNFKDSLVIDFSSIGGYQFNTECIENATITKMLIYGKNATGKTNLAEAITDILSIAGTYMRTISNTFLNADSDSNYAEFKYCFQFGKNKVCYEYGKFTPAKLKYERFTLDDIEIFNFDYETKEYEYNNLDYLSVEKSTVENFISIWNEDNKDGLFNNPPFLRWIFNNTMLSAESVLSQMRNYITSIRAFSVSSLTRSFFIEGDSFIKLLEGEKLKNLEDFFNEMGIKCTLVNKKLPDGQNEIYFKHKKLVPFFNNASSGTKVLFSIYKYMISNLTNEPSLVYMDEFDAFFHYEMSEKFLEYLKKYFPNTQVVLTTHNTNLMTNRIMRPDCLFILSQEGKITALNKATQRELREGHNLEKLYMSGEFDE